VAFLSIIGEYISFFDRIEHLSCLSLEEYSQERTAFADKLTSYPAWLDDPLRWLDIEVKYAHRQTSYVLNSTESCIHTMVSHIEMLHTRVSHPEHFGVSWDRKWKLTRDEYREKQSRLVACLKEAADIFESGQCDARGYPSLASYRVIDEKSWCGSDQLREWANTVEHNPLEVVFPMVRPDLPGLAVPFESIGTRGGAANQESALRAMVVREIAFYVPETVHHRYSTIAKLAAYVGIEVSRNYVGSLLKKGRT